MNGNTDLMSISHELFHGYQHENGQGGASIFNEVEAYVFSWRVTKDFANKSDPDNNPTGGFPLARTDSDRGRSYESSVQSLLTSKTFPKKDFINAVQLFQLESTSNAIGVYQNYPIQKDNQKNSLLFRFYP
jgi:hypothetical protein